MIWPLARRIDRRAGGPDRSEPGVQARHGGSILSDLYGEASTVAVGEALLLLRLIKSPGLPRGVVDGVLVAHVVDEDRLEHEFFLGLRQHELVDVVRAPVLPAALAMDADGLAGVPDDLGVPAVVVIGRSVALVEPTSDVRQQA